MLPEFDYFHPVGSPKLLCTLIPPRKYYVIDDDPDDQQFLTEALIENDATAQCITANNGQEAIQKLVLDLLLPDAIFLDQNMPGISGKECLVQLKQMPHLMDVPVIIYSTSFDRKEREQCLQMGAFYFLVKGFSFQALKNELMILTAALKKIGGVA